MTKLKQKSNGGRAKIAKGGTLEQQQDAREFRKECLDLRIRGYSYPAIAKYVAQKHNRPITPSTVYVHVARALEESRKEYKDKANEVLQIEIDRCDRMITALEQHCIPPDEVFDPNKEYTEEELEKAFKPSLKAMDMMEKLLDRKARLMGFYRQDDSKVKEVLPWTDDEDLPSEGTPE